MTQTSPWPLLASPLPTPCQSRLCELQCKLALPCTAVVPLRAFVQGMLAGWVNGRTWEIVINRHGKAKQISAYLRTHTEQGGHSESPRGQTSGFVLPFGDMAFSCLCFLLCILGRNIFSVVSLEDRADILGFINADCCEGKMGMTR